MRNSYYQWLISQVCDDIYDSRYYSKLLYDLDNTEFTWTVELDANRAADGISLRGDDAREGPCSVLEMMVGLSLRIGREYLEEGGSNEFFWGMIKSLGLYYNDDYSYDRNFTMKVIDKLLNRTYQYNGKGGLFMVKHPYGDMREAQIWQQAMWYVDELYSERNRGWLDG